MFLTIRVDFGIRSHLVSIGEGFLQPGGDGGRINPCHNEKLFDVCIFKI